MLLNAPRKQNHKPNFKVESSRIKLCPFTGGKNDGTLLTAEDGEDCICYVVSKPFSTHDWRNPMRRLFRLMGIPFAFMIFLGCSQSGGLGPSDSLFSECDNGLNMTVSLKPGNGAETGAFVSIYIMLPVSAQVRLTVFNSTGYSVIALVDAYCEAGIGNVGWDATNDKGETVHEGFYIYEVTAGHYFARRVLYYDE
jgi:hypothetical protein